MNQKLNYMQHSENKEIIYKDLKISVLEWNYGLSKNYMLSLYDYLQNNSIINVFVTMIIN